MLPLLNRCTPPLSVTFVFGLLFFAKSSISLCFWDSIFIPNIPGHPDGMDASDMLARNRAARIRFERNSRHAPTAEEQQLARQERALARARQARLNTDLDDFMSAASVYTDEEVRIQQV